MVRCPQDYKNVTNNYSMTSEVNVATETNSVFITPYVFSPTAYVAELKEGVASCWAMLTFSLTWQPPSAKNWEVVWQTR